MQPQPTDLICLSHLRWGFVYQRPQHLLSRFARRFRVFFFEEPYYTGGTPRLEVWLDEESDVHVVTPHLPPGLTPDEVDALQAKLLQQLLRMARSDEFPALVLHADGAGFHRATARRL